MEKLGQTSLPVSGKQHNQEYKYMRGEAGSFAWEEGNTEEEVTHSVVYFLCARHFFHFLI